MKTATSIVLTVVISVVSAGAATLVLAPRPEPAADASAAQAPLNAALVSLQAEQREQRALLDSLSLRVAAAPARDELPLADLEGTVSRLLDEHLAAQAAAAAAGAPVADAAGDDFDAEEALRQLLDPDLDMLEREELWQKVREAGLMDGVIALFEARVKANPNDPALRVELANAYLQKIFEVGNGPLAGVWATKADATFDAALALDDHHWDARFSKAVSLSFWPPIFGKQSESISQFETLLEQQKGQPAKPEFAQTYLWLGNLYQQQGKGSEALAAWKSGLQLFPDDEDLLAKLAAGG